MKLIFLSYMFSDVNADIKLSKAPNSVSGHKFQENLIKGLFQNECDLSVINIPRVRPYPDYPKIILSTKDCEFCGSVKGKNIGFINLYFLNYLTQTIKGYSALKKEFKKYKGEKFVLLTFNSNLHTCFPMLLARAFHKNVTLCNIVGDLHGKYGIKNTTPGFKGFLIRAIESVQDSIGKSFDSFVFLTKHMAKAMGVEKKPCCVVEALYDSSNLKEFSNSEKDSKKTIFYAGSICKEYGIEHLLKSFSLIEDPSYQLLIAGSGDTQELIAKYTSLDSRIKYLGFITPQEVEKNQNMSTALISPRTSEHEFVKYSFASKTLECLASGKPYIAHKLPCDPPEYESYIQYSEKESDESLKEKIIEICELSNEERELKAKLAKQFVVNEKNPRIMCKKIVDLYR